MEPVIQRRTWMVFANRSFAASRLQGAKADFPELGEETGNVGGRPDTDL
jgi:hypothetical protein